MIARPHLRALVRGGVLAALLLAAPAVSAAPGDDDATSQRIADLYKRANASYKDAHLAEAEALYLEAWKLKKTYDVACNFGAVELDLGKPREAAEYLSFALREFPAGEKVAAREQIKARLALARAQIGAVRVRVNVAGAQVTVGDRVAGKSPLDEEVFVNPGVVAVSASAPGYDPATRSVPVAKGGSADVALTLAEPRKSLVPVFVAGGVGVVALATGAGVLIVAGQKGSSAQALSTAIAKTGSCVTHAPNYDARCPQLSSTAKLGDTLHGAGVGLMIGGGAAAAAAIVYALWPRSGPSGARTGSLRVVPAVSASHGGLIFSGAF